MKNQRVLLLSALLLGFIVVLDACKLLEGCNKKYPTSKTFELKGKNNQTVRVETPFSPNELVLYYTDETATDSIKEQQDYLRSKGFQKVDSCQCSKKLELWRHPSTNPGTVDLIGVVDGAPKPKTGGVGDGIYLNYTLEDGDPIPKDTKPVDTTDISTYNSPINGTRNTTIAIVDAGVAYDHRELQPRLWKNSEVTGCNKAVWGLDVNDTSAEPRDLNGHGSIVSGIALGLSKPSESSNNVAIKTMNIRFTNGGTNEGNLFDAICGILYALENEVKVINLSWGFFEVEEGAAIFKPILKEAEKQHAIFVAGMGNKHASLDGPSKFWPACFSKESSSMVAVVSVNRSNQISSFSNWTTDPSVVFVGALGEDVISTYPPGLNGLGANGYIVHSGTSMATPYVARTLAIMLARDRNRTPDYLRTSIRASASSSNTTTADGTSIMVPVLNHSTAVNSIPEI